MLILHDYNDTNKYLAGIYCIINSIDDRIYIGSTKCFKRRFTEHLADFAENTHSNKHLLNFVNKYGVDTLTFKVVEILDFDVLLIREQWYLDNVINFKKDFNICRIAGSPPPTNKKFVEEDIIKIAKLYNEGMSCCKISELLFNSRNWRGLLSQITRGESYSEFKHLFNYRKYDQTGRKFNQSTKDKIGKANKGNPNIGGKGIEREGRGKLSRETVLYIRHNVENYPQSKLALMFDISKSLVKDIQRMRTYTKF